MSSIEARGKSSPHLASLLLMIFSICPSTGGAMQSRNESYPRRTLVVMGIVVLEDGTPPPFGVVIERDCGQGYKKEIDAEVSGHFLFEMKGGSLPELTPGDFSARDQSPSEFVIQKRELPVPLEVNLCELRARLQGFHSTAVRIAGDPSSTKVDVGNIVLYPNRKNRSSVADVKSLKVPREARKALERAQKALKKKEFEKASSELKTALAIYPQYAEAWYRLGWVDEQWQKYERSREEFHKSIAMDAAYVPPYLGLASAAWRQQDWPAMKRWSEQALKLNGRGFPEAYFLNALALYHLNMLEAAEEVARKAQQMDSAHRLARIHLVLAEILFRKRDIPGSIAQMRDYLRFAPKATDAAVVRDKMIEREKISRQSVAIILPIDE